MASRAYFGPEDTEAIDTEELLRRLESGDTLILDVRPDPEYAGGHLPGAVHIPLEQLAAHLAELPRDKEIVGLLPWQVLRPRTRRRSSARPPWTHRAARGRGCARVARPGRCSVNPASRDGPARATAIPPVTAAPLDAARASLCRRSLTGVVISQVFGGCGSAAGVTVGALLAQDMLGSEAVAGLPAALFTLGSAIAAYTVGRLSQAAGRRNGLAAGFFAGGSRRCWHCGCCPDRQAQPYCSRHCSSTDPGARPICKPATQAPTSHCHGGEPLRLASPWLPPPSEPSRAPSPASC
jgi:Rhodanese-like domain